MVPNLRATTEKHADRWPSRERRRRRQPQQGREQLTSNNRTRQRDFSLRAAVRSTQKSLHIFSAVSRVCLSKTRKGQPPILATARDPTREVHDRLFCYQPLLSPSERSRSIDREREGGGDSFVPAPPDSHLERVGEQARLQHDQGGGRVLPAEDAPVVARLVRRRVEQLGLGWDGWWSRAGGRAGWGWIFGEGL